MNNVIEMQHLQEDHNNRINQQVHDNAVSFRSLQDKEKIELKSPVDINTDSDLQNIHASEDTILDNINFYSNLNPNLKSPPKANNLIENHYRYQDNYPTISNDALISMLPETPSLKPVQINPEPLKRNAEFYKQNPSLLTSKEKERLAKEAKIEVKNNIQKLAEANVKLNSNDGNLTGKLHEIKNSTESVRIALKAKVGEVNYDNYHNQSAIIKSKLKDKQKLSSDEAKYLNSFAIGNVLSSKSTVASASQVLTQIDSIMGSEKKKPIINKDASKNSPKFGATLQTLDNINQTIASNSAQVQTQSPLDNFLDNGKSGDN